MSEATGEMMSPMEKESGVLRKMSERVGKFLSETYTFKGAKAKELIGFEKSLSHFTPSQQEEMREYFDKKADVNSKWKVIRNWVVTGAGLTLGAAVLANPAGAWALVEKAGEAVVGWWHQAATAIGGAAAGVKETVGGVAIGAQEGAGKVGVAVRDWLFDFHNRPVIPVDMTKAAYDYNTYGLGALIKNTGNAITDTQAGIHAYIDSSIMPGVQEGWTKGLQPFLLKIAKGPQFGVPTFVVK
jgi:hypothetical protein